MAINRETLTSAEEWRRYWPMVVAASMGFGFFSVMQVYTGIFMGPVSEEFGWSKTELTAGLSLSSIIVMVLSPFFGVLIDRWGTRRLVLPGLLMKALVFAGFSYISGSWTQWMAMWVIYALVSLCIKSTVWTAAVASVFNSGRGLALGVTLSGTALAQVIVPPLGNWLITEFGWRMAFILLGTIWGGFAFTLCLFFLYDGHDHLREARKQAVANDTPPPSLPGLTAHEALRCAALWRIGISTFIMMTVTIALVVHQFPILVEAGISREKAALLASLGGVAGIIGKITTGALLDRFKPNWVGGITLSSAAIAFALLLEEIRTPALIVVAMVINGYASGTKLQICGYLTTRYAGLKNFGLIFSVMASAIALSSALGPVLGSFFYDTFGSYNGFLVIGMVGSLISGWLIFGLGKYPDWHAVEQQSVSVKTP
jgi:predicted MFS family arabinose efflux permease